MNRIRNHSKLRFFWLFMAIYILNCSVDSPDMYGESVPEDMEFNDMESIVELILEKVLALGDVIPEYDDSDSEEEKTFKFKKGLEPFQLTGVHLYPKNSFTDEGASLICSANFLLGQFIKSPISPPPWFG